MNHTIASDLEFHDDWYYNNLKEGEKYRQYTDIQLYNLGGEIDEKLSDFKSKKIIWKFPDNSKLLVTRTSVCEVF